ncbi:hypothetical protein J6590_011163 [Homalodisca vitripennis]|nr:hypothetical protein J6590_011163 [Homalodisca vitripennis]
MEYLKPGRFLGPKETYVSSFKSLGYFYQELWTDILTGTVNQTILRRLCRTLNKKNKECLILSDEVRAKMLSLTINLATNGLKVTSEPPPMAGQAGCLQGQDRSAVTYPSSSHAGRCLIRLSRDNRRAPYTALLALIIGCKSKCFSRYIIRNAN